jgi:hypothetical protein
MFTEREVRLMTHDADMIHDEALVVDHGDYAG